MVTTTCAPVLSYVEGLDGPNAACPERSRRGWVTTALESAFARCGAPKYIITDQESVFTSATFAELKERWGFKQRFGAVGQHGSIAVTE
ncbi:MAG TPA: transposase family protein, partial [Armatimonadota bacterium]|nr:transposase family protein [Armatimonadota bacterium]